MLTSETGRDWERREALTGAAETMYGATTVIAAERPDPRDEPAAADEGMTTITPSQTGIQLAESVRLLAVQLSLTLN